MTAPRDVRVPPDRIYVQWRPIAGVMVQETPFAIYDGAHGVYERVDLARPTAPPAQPDESFTGPCPTCGQEDMRSGSPWIDVRQRLPMLKDGWGPSQSDTVLVLCSGYGGQARIARLTTLGWSEPRVTYWTPIPGPLPKELP